jgi:hypothetical protein
MRWMNSKIDSCNGKTTGRGAYRGELVDFGRTLRVKPKAA